MFLRVFLIGIALVILQGVCSYFDGYFTQFQMQAAGIMNGYSFMEHGGMWADIIVISPMVAYIVSRYRLKYTSWYSILIFVIAVGITIAAGIAYKKIGLIYPTPHSHDGRTTAAGWIHGVFAIAALWIAGMFYFTPTNPHASTRDVLVISGLLTPFFFLGIVDFNSRWVFMHGAKIQLAVSIAILWIITAIKLFCFS
ncbi:MAG TPA: hypothetical protein VMR99_03020 [Candidatus Paceibacterota bacterium]|nr:hypothetical protein [Candidatus Paceibacterota bacterium]